MLQFFGLLAGLLPLLGAIPYIADMFKHKTKPHRASFLIWTVLGAIAFFAQMADGASWSLLLPAADTLAVVVVLVLSIRYGTGGLSKYDIGSLLLAGLGLLLWYFTKQPIAALGITIGIDAIGTALTLIKTYHEPHTETLSSWLLASLGGLFAALAVKDHALNLLVYPAYILTANGAVGVVICLRRSKVRPTPNMFDATVSPYAKEPS